MGHYGVRSSRHPHEKSKSTRRRQWRGTRGLGLVEPLLYNEYCVILDAFRNVSTTHCLLYECPFYVPHGRQAETYPFSSYRYYSTRAKMPVVVSKWQHCLPHAHDCGRRKERRHWLQQRVLLHTPILPLLGIKLTVHTCTSTEFGFGSHTCVEL